MDIIHFTQAAADPLEGLDSSGCSFLPLARTDDNASISCLHLRPDAFIRNPSTTHAAALLCIHGIATVTTQFPAARIDLHAGMGAILEKYEGYSLTSTPGAIVLIVESQQLAPDPRAISTPQRIAGARWP